MVKHGTSTKFLRRFSGAILLIAATGVAQADPIYTYSLDENELSQPRAQRPNGGRVFSIETSYDATSEQFTWTYTASTINDAFALVVSDGDEPEDDNEYAVLYGDVEGGLVTAYVYDRRSASGSNVSTRALRDPANYIDTYALSNSVSGNRRTVSLTIDASDINTHLGNSGWKGIGFDDTLGFWFNPFRDTTIRYAAGGAIDSFGPRGRGDVDRSGQPTQVASKAVPEPGMLYLCGVGLLALAFARARRASRRPAARLVTSLRASPGAA